MLSRRFSRTEASIYIAECLDRAGAGVRQIAWWLSGHSFAEGTVSPITAGQRFNARPAVSTLIFVDNSPKLTKWPLEFRNIEKIVGNEAISKVLVQETETRFHREPGKIKIF